MATIVINQPDWLGETLALAVRIHEAALPGSVTLSGYAHQFVRGKIGIQFEDCGTRPLKNIAEPMRLWRWGAAVGEGAGDSLDASRRS